MEERIYDYWAATLQDGYIADLTGMTAAAGGARALYEMTEKQMMELCHITGRLAGYITDRKTDISLIEREYYMMQESEINYVNHTDPDFPVKLANISGRPYGLFVKGTLPDKNTCTVSIVGARECSEYGRKCAELFG